ncbi:MAG: tRNA guanosine(34) transglycosylase Tgt [Acidobacteriota bacterium]|nr:tRNA guanosine(34) transglycosylase Tgt [Acidobacteriota bacterium]
MSFSFQVEATCGRARAGRIITPHGEIETPVFMPVGTVGSVKGLSQDVLDKLGVQILLNNTYHLYLRPGVETVRALGGAQKFMSWNKPILTDSGGFQVFSLGDLTKKSEDGVQFRSHLDGSSHFFSPETSLAAEIGIGADIVMAFDECTEYPATRERARQSMEMTARWARRSRDYFEAHKHEVPWFKEKSLEKGSDQTQALFGIVQGGMYNDLRRESAERTVELDFPGYALGGLSVGEPRPETWKVVNEAIPLLPANKPRYVMGVGTPEEIVEYVRHGVDMMDCVLPTRAARHGLLFTSEGKINIKNARFARDESPLDPRCPCTVCARYSRAYLRHLYASQEILAQVLNTQHNLAYYLGLMRRVRQSIISGEFADAPSAV